LAKLLCNVPAGVAADRIGRRPLLIGGCALEAVAMAAMAVSTTQPEMIAASAAAGVEPAAPITLENAKQIASSICLRLWV
jgi:MFS family permease